MVRAKLWFRCAALGDPVTPIQVRPALIGWDAKMRKIDLTIERSFKGEELLMRMKGWITVDPKRVIEIVRKYGVLKVLDDRDLVFECETLSDLERLNEELKKEFNDQIEIEVIKK
ncbi:MAG: hypothetical protein NZ583_00305 [Desulfobacterota bacterium]|nr:hypothetical protein [Thermodesulfobacteriota bacterium]MDW8001155.1 hypothetical protein [Deltaproteobacteria bacterium]